MKYKELIEQLREHRCDATEDDTQEFCEECAYDVIIADKNALSGIASVCVCGLMHRASDAIEELEAQLMYSNDAAKAIAEKVPKWIPVTERLPEKDGWYLVYAPEYSGGSSTGLKCIDGRMFCKFDHGKWSIEHGYYRRPHCVTHWMPLPEPPKEET